MWITSYKRFQNFSVTKASETELRPFVEIYDAIFASKDYDGEVARVLSLLRDSDQSNFRILEIGSGTCSHSVSFVKQGVRVTAVDTDYDMTSKARSKLVNCSMISVHNGDLGETPLVKYDGACALFYVVNYVRDRQDLRKLFKDVRGRLAVGGKFFFDCWNGVLSLIEEHPASERDVTTPEGVEFSYKTEVVVDKLQQEAKIRYQFTKHSSQPNEHFNDFEENIIIRLWTLRELEETLQESGFCLLNVSQIHPPFRPASINDARIAICAMAE
tara:strand:+ start:73 stop:888 length:816 start_codon:yes stop_codon:yes gene_type:complete